VAELRAATLRAAARARLGVGPGLAPTERLSVVPWPLATVEQRDIAAYAEAVGGA